MKLSKFEKAILSIDNFSKLCYNSITERGNPESGILIFESEENTMKKEKAIYYADIINRHTDFIARADIDYLSKSWYVQILGDKYYTSNKIENSVIWELATKNTTN